METVNNILLSEYVKSLLRESINDIPDLPDICINKNTGEKIRIPKNRLVSNFHYFGITPEVADRIHRLCVHHLWNPSEITKKGIEAAYIYIIYRNPEIKDIKLNISGYDPLRSPMHDIIHGVASGIEPYNIFNFVENLKGNGTRSNSSKNSSKGYITT